MKAPFRLLIIFAIAALAACTKDIPSVQDEGSRVIAVSFATQPQTRTALGEDGRTPVFQEGDKIRVSNGSTVKTITVHVDENGNAFFSTILSGELTAVYPADAAEVKNNVIKGIRVPAEQSGKFADSNIAIAEHIADYAHFENCTALFIVTPPPGAATLKVTSLPTVISGERTGEAVPVNTEGVGEEANRVTAKGLDEDGKFYVSLYPGVCLSDLAFETQNARREFSIDDIIAAETENMASAGKSYLINGTKWQTLSQTIEEANNALKTGKTSIEINNPTDPETPVILPAVLDGKNVSVTISGVSAYTMAFRLEDGANGPANLYIGTDAQDLVINLPNSHVEVNGGNYQTVTATTSASTLVVGGDVSIGSLVLQGGNAVIRGLVTAITRAGGAKADWYADTRAELIAGLRNATNGESVILSSDIDLDNEDWDPIDIGRAIVFDGGGHTISNLRIAGVYDDGHYGLIGHMYSSAVIRNLTIDGAEILPPASKGGDSRGAALVGIIRSGNLENCHVKNVTVRAYQKIGGLVGQLSLEGSGTSYVKDCSADDVTVGENMTGEGVWGTGGLIGSLCLENDGHNVTISGCSVKGISISNSTTEACPQQTAHAFIGTIRGNSNAVVTLAGNVVEQTAGLYTDLYSSAYFGWAPNAEYYSTLNCRIEIDGQTWYPDYPFQNITKGINYPTMEKATAAASAGDVIHVTKAGEYTVGGVWIPEGGTLEATVPGVKFNYTSPGLSENWILNSGANATVKNITWNILNNANYQFIHVANVVGCTINGRIYPHGTVLFTDCTFNSSGYEYCVTTWASGSTFSGCTFNTQGKAVNVYGGSLNTYTFEDCVFNATDIPEGKGKAAIFVKDGVDSDCGDVNVVITGCSASYERPYDQLDTSDSQLSGSVLWNVEKGNRSAECDVKVTLDGTLVYSGDNVVPANPEP